MKTKSNLKNSRASSKKEKTSKREILFGVALVKEIVVEALTDYSIDPRGKSKEEIESSVRAYLAWLKSRGRRKILFNFDNRSSILTEARKQRTVLNKELSCTLYAIWFEHWINRLIMIYGNRKKLSGNELYAIIRTSRISDKFTWLAKLLGIPRILRHHITTILQIHELRNTFVHYKWRSKTGKEVEDFDDKLDASLDKVEKVVKYLSTLENKHVYHGSKAKIKSLFPEVLINVPPNQALH
jgi:hypothetical protein